MNLPARNTASKPDNREAGFTITEILVVITVGSLTIGFALSLFLFVGKLVSRWQKDAELKDQVRGVVAVLAQDVDRSLSVQSPDDSTWVVVLPSAREVVYRASGGMVCRNDIRLAGDRDVSIHLTVTPFPSQGSPTRVEKSFFIVAEGSRRGRIERASAAVAVAGSSKLAFSSRSM